MNIVIQVVLGINILVLFQYCVCDSNPTTNNAQEKLLLVQISFDSLQEGSQTFFKTQLQPIFEQFSCIVNWDFIPCSTSMVVNDELKCIRGPEECQIDRIHACTSAIYRNDSYMLGKFFICMMTNAQQMNAAPQCAAEANFDWSEIEGCSKTDRAAEFCENRFEVLNKYHVRLVPGIFYNKKYNQEVDTQSCNNLKGVICEKLATLSVSFEGCNC